MKSFIYTIKDEVGIHARPAGLLAKKAKEFDSVITVTKDDKTVIATKLMAIMSMGIKQGDTVTVTAEGTDESDAIKAMEKFFADNL
ncbi:MAG: HPr family phosphocarrier protein [Eubacteriales bacterium]|nr:HPr family phosphocarrier protein [Eubacteriales bacterium]